MKNYSPEIKRKSGIPVYIQLAELIKKQIKDGEIKPGDKLLSENEMVKKYGVARLTVREALSKLLNEGLIEKHHGKGTFLKTASKRKNIDVILDMSDYYFIPYYIQSISNALEEGNCNFVVHDSKNLPDVILNQLENIRECGTDGVILQGSASEKVDKEALYSALSGLSDVPVVIIDHDYGFPGFCEVIMDEFEAGRISGDCFMKNGHKKAAAVCTENSVQSNKRLEGFRSVYKNCEVIKVEDYITSKEQNELKTSLLECVKKGVTAIFCFNDHYAKKSIDYLKENGYGVPDDISVIGVDDTTMAKLYDFTSVEHPKQLLGDYAAKEVMKSKPEGKIFIPQLNERKSVKKLN